MMKFLNMEIKKDKIVLCFLAGILLLVMTIPTKKNSVKTSEMVGDTAVVSDYADILEKQLEQILSQIENIGQVDAMITMEPLVDNRESPEIRGVIIVAESGDDPVQVLKIQETVMTLFQIDAHRIKVMKLK